MRRYFNLIVLLLCLCGTLYAQSPVLEKKVTLQYRETEIGQILKDLHKKYEINFSYSSNIVPEKKKVSISIKNVMLKDALNDLFKETDVAFQVIGEQIVFKKGVRKNSSALQKYRVQTGHYTNTVDVAKPILYDPKTHQEDLLASSDADFIIDTMPDELGMEVPLLTEDEYHPSKKDLRRKFKIERQLLKLKFALIKDSLRRKGGNSTSTLEMKYNYIEQKMKEQYYKLMYAPDKKKDTAHITPTPADTLQKNDTTTSDRRDDYLYRPFQITFVSPLGTNGVDCGRTVNAFSLNALGGYSAGLQGLEMGGIANIETDYMHGIQMAGVANVVGNETRGMQLAGVINVCGDTTKAFQAAGFANVVNGSFTGMQGAGFCNVDNGSVFGFQGAGFLNVCRDSITGMQVAGFANINSGDVKGVQAAGFINTAKKVKGVQLGIINIADTIEGVPIGLLSIVRKGGYRRYDIYGTESLYGNFAFKIGVRRLYNIFTVGTQYKNDQFRFGTGYGLGTEFALGNRGVVNIEGVTMNIWQAEKIRPELNTLNRLSTTFGVRLGQKNTTIYAGPAFNVMVSSQYLKGHSEPGSDIAPYTFYNHTFKGEKDVNLQMWIGFNAGIRF
ncbi:MAG TPA: STN domain-containing protein [Cytophagaceae bacterium]|nr:STN domain-containing protein [Cytophagaceae bacterium]